MHGVIVGDTKGMSLEEFAASRTGLGGSDQAALFGISPWDNLYALWCRTTKKQKLRPQRTDSERFALFRGHAFEEPVAQMFRFKTGYELKDDTNIYAHPDYLYLRANLDRIYERKVTDKEGQSRVITGVLECKTTTPDNPDVELWKKGICPMHYLVQVHFYLLVTGLEEAHIVCMWGFKDRDYVHIHIPRNKDLEKKILQTNVAFWEKYVLTDKKPPLLFAKQAQTVVKSLQEYTEAKEDKPWIILDEKHRDRLKKMETIDFKVKELQDQIKELKEVKARLQIPLCDEMGEVCEAMLSTGDGSTCFHVTYRPREKTSISVEALMKEAPELVPLYTSVNLQELKKEFPTIAEKLSETKAEGRTFSVRKKQLTQTLRLEYDLHLAAQKGV